MSHHSPLSYQPCKVPLRRAMGVFGGVNLAVHAGIYEDVMEADRRWRAAGGKNFFVIRASDTGSYNCRPSAAHSRAVAIDFNWSSNPYGPKRVPCPQQPGFRVFYERCWKPLGYGWGGQWNSKCDAMHISKLASEGGDGVLWRKWGVSEEDDMAQVPQKEWDEVKADVDRCVKALFKSKGTFNGEHLTRIDNMLTALGARLDPPLVFGDDGTAKVDG